MSIRFVAEAEQDLDEAVSFYDTRRKGLGTDFASEVAAGLELILERPKAWHPIGPRTRRFRLRRFPYNLIYHILPDSILILAVAHQRRHPGYWRHRTPEPSTE